MVDIRESHAAMSEVTFGDADKHHDRTRPTLEADGRLHMDPEDGRVLATVDARSVIQTVRTLENTEDLWEMTKAFGRSETYFRMFHFRLVVTEARLIWEQTEPAGSATKMVGHLRFPWISVVAFRPKQSFLNDALMRLEFNQDFPVAERGGWFHTVDLGFHKDFNPGPLAHLVAQQIARHHLKYGAPDSATQALQALAAIAPVADPAKGQEAPYYIPAHATYPGCVDYIGDGIVGGEWLVAESALGSPADSDAPSPSSS